MKKKLILVIFIFFASLLTAEVNEPKKIFKLQRAYIYLEEALLISESDLNCSYFIKDGMPQAMEIVASYHPDQQRVDFSDSDRLFVNQGARDGLKEGEMLLIMNRGRQIRGVGRYIQKKSLAEITKIYEDKALISLKSGCHPVHVGDLAVPFTPEKTVFAKKIDYLFARIPESPVSGAIVYNDLTSGTAASISSSSQYVTVDLGKGVVDKGSYLLICRILKEDLPPLIIGLGIVIHAENTNSTVKILDSNSDIQVNDVVMLLAAPKTDAAGADRTDNIPIVETLQAETQGEENAQPVNAAVAEQAFDGLTVDVLFEFDGKQPKGDHSADFAAIRDFIAAKSEYVVTLRGYTCSIGNEEYNLRLSTERVETVKNILVSQYGVDLAHVESFFYGEREAGFDNSSEAERLKNRLVKITVSGK